MSDEWNSDMEAAPKDGSLVRLRSEHFAPQDLFGWSRRHKRWETTLFTIMRAVPGWWDEDAAEQPTHWRPLPAPSE